MRYAIASYADFHAKLCALLEDLEHGRVAKLRPERVDIVVEAAISRAEAELDAYDL